MLVERACALVDQSASGLTWPPIVRLGSWQARQSWPFELSFTRKFSDTGSLACTCGLWHDVHSTLPLISFTAPVGSAVDPIRRQRSSQIDIVLQGKRQAERVRGLHVAAEHIGRVHRSARRDLPIGHRRSHRDGAVMAAQALIADGAEHRLCVIILLGAAAVGRVGLRGELLVPEARIQSGVRSMAVCAGVRPGARDRGLASRAQIVHAQCVAGNLRMTQTVPVSRIVSAASRILILTSLPPGPDSSGRHIETPGSAG